MFKIFKKAFISSGEWNIAFRKKEPFFNYSSSFIPLPKNKDYWFADPFLLEKEGRTFLFCEAFSKKEQIGMLAKFELEKDEWCNFEIIINENYHMSYPYIFQYQSRFYIIPETSENRTLDVYECIDFPSKWIKKRTLLSDIDIVDTNVLLFNGRYYLIGSFVENGVYITKIYSLDLEKFDIGFLKEIAHTENTNRSAGPFFCNNNSLVRPSQDCRAIYGGSIIFNRIISETEEKPFFSLDVNKVSIEKTKPSRVHTYSSTNFFEAIDYSIFKFNLFKIFEVLRRKKATKSRKGKK